MAFCHRLAEETGRQVYLIVNGFGGLSISNWIGAGTSSQLYQAMKKDVADALAAIGQTKIHYFLWQQGEADAADTSYAAKVQTLLTQMRAESWWGTNTYFLAGEPCRSSQNANLANLLAEVAKLETDGDPKTMSVSSMGLPYIVEGAKQHFDGDGLWALGYGRYYAALATDPAFAGVPDPVPAALFRWEQKTGYNVGPTILDLTISGTATADAPGDDPIGMKILRANTMQMHGVEIINIRNIGRMMEGVVNSRDVQCTIEGCGFQPTDAGGSGFLPETVRFDVSGTAVVASEPVFDASMAGKPILLHEAGPNKHVHRSFFTYVDSTHITLSSAASLAATGTTGSFDSITGSIAAGSNMLILGAGTGINYLGRYVMVLFAGSSATPNLDHLVTRVTGRVGNVLLLASPARFNAASVPVIVAPADFIGRTTDDYPRNGGRNSTSANDIQSYGLRNENPSYKGRSSALTLFINDAINVSFVGGKLHGQPPLYSNFGSNAGIYVADNCTGLVFDGMQLKWGKYSGTYGSQIVSGQETGLILRDVQIGNNFATANARHFYIAPRSSSLSWNVMLSGLDQSGNGWPNTYQGLARYGTYGSPANFTAIGPLLLNGVVVGANKDEPVHRLRSIATSGNIGLGMEPSSSAAVKMSIFYSGDYIPREMYRGDDRFFDRLTSTGLFLGKTVGGVDVYPVQINWGASAQSLVIGDTYVQVRKPRLTGIPTYANNAEALAGGLVAGDVYKITGGGQLAIVL